MPSRWLREYADSERVDRLSEGAETLFIRLLTKADDFGRFPASTKLVKAACFPLKPDAHLAKIPGWLKELTDAELVIIYESQGKAYLSIYDYRQRTRATRSKYPAPPGCEHTWLPTRLSKNDHLQKKLQLDDTDMFPKTVDGSSPFVSSYDGHTSDSCTLRSDIRYILEHKIPESGGLPAPDREPGAEKPAGPVADLTHELPDDPRSKIRVPSATIKPWYDLAYSAFPVKPPTFPNQIVWHQCRLLFVDGRDIEDFRRLCGWVRSAQTRFRPNSPAKLTQPDLWEQWLSMAAKDAKEDGAAKAKAATLYDATAERRKRQAADAALARLTEKRAETKTEDGPP